MSVELVNGFVLIPHAPDWNVKIQFRREWRTGLADAVTGAEDRLGFRHLPLRGVEYQVTPFTLEEQRRLAGRILAAKKSGWAAVPLWGRGSAMASPASGDSVTLISETAWTWTVGDFAFFSNIQPDEPESFDIRQVDAVAGATLTLDQALTQTYYRFCWPVIFGRFRCNDLRTLTSYHGSVRIRVLERDVRPEPNSDLCAIILTEDGGGDNFDCYAQAIVVNGLGGGTYFNGPWIDDPLFVGLQDQDPFDGYVAGVALNNLAKGTVWAGPWVDSGLFVSLQALDNFDTYTASQPVDGLTGGSGFGAAWVDSNLG